MIEAKEKEIEERDAVIYGWSETWLTVPLNPVYRFLGVRVAVSSFFLRTRKKVCSSYGSLEMKLHRASLGW